MTRTLPFLCLLALAGCLAPDPNPLAWSATYPRPYEAMTNCLAQHTPVDYQVVPMIDGRQGIGGVLLTFRSSGQRAGEFDVRRLNDTTSQVTFRSAVRTVGGSSFLEDQAHQVANSCAS